MKKTISFVLLIALCLACAPHAAMAQQLPEVNQAIVEIDGETVVMQAVSMVEGQFPFDLNKNSMSIMDKYHRAQMVMISFIEIESRHGYRVKDFALTVPGNWEAGRTYLSSKTDKLFGIPAIYYYDRQSGERLASNSWIFGLFGSTPRVQAVPSYSVAVIVDEASSDYSVIKGRFEATHNREQYRNITGIFYVDASEFLPPSPGPWDDEENPWGDTDDPWAYTFDPLSDDETD